jgi:hypothetical protein
LGRDIVTGKATKQAGSTTSLDARNRSLVDFVDQ